MHARAIFFNLELTRRSSRFFSLVSMESSSAALNLHSSICFQFQFQYPTRADFSDLVRTQGARECVQHQRLQMSVPFLRFYGYTLFVVRYVTGSSVFNRYLIFIHTMDSDVNLYKRTSAKNTDFTPGNESRRGTRSRLNYV